MATVGEVREQVRIRYAAQAVAHQQDCGCGGASCCSDGSCCSAAALDQDGKVFGSGLYATAELGELPETWLASLGCGNPVAVTDLRPGETVLDLGSGGGIDVLLSASRVGPDGFAYGVDMTEEILDLARGNAAKAGATNVEFRQGTIEGLPLPDASVDVVISNCVINLSADKARARAEMFRVLKPVGRVGVSDVVAEDQLTAADRAARGSFSGCIPGALSKQEYLDGLAAAGFTDASVRFTHEAEPQMHAAVVHTAKPTTSISASPTSTASRAEAVAKSKACCDHAAAAECCSAQANASCCGTTAATDLPTTRGCR